MAGPAPPAPPHWGARARVARSGWWGAAGRIGLSHALFPMARPALLGWEGPGSQQQRVRTSPCQSQLLAAIWAGAVPVFQICLPFGEPGNSVLGRYLSLIPRLSVENPTQAAPEKGRTEKCHGLGSFQRDLLWVFLSKQSLYSHSLAFASSISHGDNLLLFFNHMYK